MSDEIRCPVCNEDFSTEQGRGGHLSSMKDAQHEAYRALGKLPEPTAQPKAERSPQPERAPTEPVREPVVEPTLASPAPQPQAQPDPQGSAPSQQGSEPSPAFIEVSIEPPKVIEPLMPEAQASPGSKAESARKPPSVAVPLEPLVAGAVAQALNGLVLSKPEDRKLGPDEVRGTGFPAAAEACVRHYYPDLPLDHPVAALLISGANLAMLVQSYKGALKAPEPAPQASPVETKQDPQPSAPTPVPPQPGTTGDPYWDAILRGAGGAQ